MFTVDSITIFLNYRFLMFDLFFYFLIFFIIIQFFVFKVDNISIFENIALKKYYKIYHPLFIIQFFVFKVDFDLFFLN